LPIGSYVVELELIYPYGIAPSSAHFDIVESVHNLFSLAAYWIILAIVMISSLLIVLTIVRLVRKNRQVNYEPQVSSY
jgi:heme/copper-type cytochrome/quinol oxidase subunit 2